MQYAQTWMDSSLCDFVQDVDMRTQCVENSMPDPEPTIEVYALGVVPQAIAVGASESIDFHVGYRGTTSLPSVQLLEVGVNGETVRTVGELHHDGTGMVAGQYAYTGTYVLGPYAEERTLRLQARFLWGGAVATTSDASKLVVTRFPIRGHAFDVSMVVADPITGRDIVGNEVSLGVREDTNPDRVKRPPPREHGSTLVFL